LAAGDRSSPRIGITRVNTVVGVSPGWQGHRVAAMSAHEHRQLARHRIDVDGSLGLRFGLDAATRCPHVARPSPHVGGATVEAPCRRGE
jgi:hypothetical protein